jgi:hypothetical protein
MNKFKSKKNFWYAMTPIIAIMVGYGAYLIYSYKTGLNDDFTRRYGMILTEAQMNEAELPKGNVLNAKEAIALVRENTDVLQEVSDGNKRNEGTEKYEWKAIALMDSELKNWKVTVREYEVRPKVVCQAKVISSTAQVIDYRCFDSKI